MRWSGSIGRCVLFGVLAASGAAVAQPAPAPTPAAEERAQALYEQGTTHYKVAEYDEAIAAFKEAYKTLPMPLILYNIGQAYRQKHDCAAARTFYKNYLREESEGETADQARVHLAEMEACAATATGDGPGPKGPGTGTGRVIGDGTGTGTQTGTVAGTGAAIDRGKSKRMAGMVVGGVGVGLVVFGVVQGMRASGKADDLASSCTVADPCTPDEWRTIDDAGQSAQTTQVLGLAIGGVAVAAGAGLYLWGRSSSHERPMALNVTPTRGGAAVGATFSF